MVPITVTAARIRSLFAGEGLRARSLWGSMLVTGAFGIEKVLQLGSSLILTRILFPEAFGLMALVSAFIGGLTLLSDIGINASLIRSHRSDEPRYQATAWTMQVVRGLWITALAWVFAWPYALTYGQEMLFPLICVSALNATVVGFKSVQMAVLQRQLILGRVLTLQLLSQVIAVAMTVLLAWQLQSVWGLAIGGVLGSIVTVTMGHILLPSPNHRFVWDRSVVKEIGRFGRWILLGTLFTYLGGKGIVLVRGYFLELDVLGVLRIAGLMSWIIGDLTGTILSKVAFPAMSQVARNRPQEIGRVAGRIHLYQTLVTTPASILLAVIAIPLIHFLYDPRYAEAGLFLALLSLNSAIAMIPMVYQNAMLALGDSRTHAMIMFVSAGLKILGVIVGFYLGGVIGMILAAGVSNLVTLGAALAVSARRGFASPLVDGVNLAVILAIYAVFLLYVL